MCPIFYNDDMWEEIYLQNYKVRNVTIPSSCTLLWCGYIYLHFGTVVTIFGEEVNLAAVDMFFCSIWMYPSPWYLFPTNWPRISSSFVFPVIIHCRDELILLKSSLRTLKSFYNYTLESWRFLHFMRIGSISLVNFFLSCSKQYNHRL